MVTVAIVSFDSPTSTGNQDITTPALGGRTPKLAIVVMVGHNPANDPNGTPTNRFSISASDGSDLREIASKSQDNNAQTFVRKATIAGTEFIGLYDAATNGTAIAATLNSFIANGMRVSWNTVAANSFRGYVIFFASATVSPADFLAKTGVISLGTGTSAITTNVGFQPHVVFFFGVNGSIAANLYGLTVGIAGADGTQKSISWAENNAIAAGGQPSQVLDSTHGSIQESPTAATIDYKITAGNFTATGFDLTPSASAGSDNLAYAAMNLGTRGYKIWDFSTPTSTGVASDTTPGFRPQLGMMFGTNLEALDTPKFDDDLAGGFSSSAFTSSQYWATALRTANADPTSTESDSKSVAFQSPSGTDIDQIIASFVSMDNTGWTLDYTAVAGAAKKGFAFAIEANLPPIVAPNPIVPFIPLLLR